MISFCSFCAFSYEPINTHVLQAQSVPAYVCVRVCVCDLVLLLACAPYTAIFRKLAAISIAKLSRRCLLDLNVDVDMDRHRPSIVLGRMSRRLRPRSSTTSAEKYILQNVFLSKSAASLFSFSFFICNFICLESRKPEKLLSLIRKRPKIQYRALQHCLLHTQNVCQIYFRSLF